MSKPNEMDYLFISTRIRFLETQLLDSEQIEAMLDAHSHADAIKILLDRGYNELEEINMANINEMLAKERQRVLADISFFVPDQRIVDVFKLKYDYHNVKVLLKSECMGFVPEGLLIDSGRVPARELQEAVRSTELSFIPPILKEAILKARDVLGTTQDPQLADCILDRAYFQDLFQISEETGSKFLEGYVRVMIDGANLRSVVRTLRMGKNSEFLDSVLFRGGNVDTGRIMNCVAAGSSFDELFGNSRFQEAVEAGTAAIHGGSLTPFEKLCDNAINKYLGDAKYIAFGEATVIAYLAAKENELTTIRIIMSGRLSGIPADIIRERLRDIYV